MSPNTFITEKSTGTKTINDRIDRFNTLSRKNVFCNHERALSLAERALALSKEYGYEKGRGNSLVSMGMAYSRMSQLEKSSVCLFEAIPILQKLGDKQDMVQALNASGTNYLFYGRLEESLECFNKGKNLAVEIGDERMVGVISNNTGAIYNEMGKYDEAADCYKLGYKTSKKIKNLVLEATSISNIGQASFKLGNYSDALRYYRHSLAISRKIDDRIYIADTLNLMGEVYCRLGLIKKAMDFYMKSLEIFGQENEKYFQADVYVNLGFLYMDNNQYDKAAESFKTALSMAESISANKKVYMIHNHLSNLYEKTGDYEKALYHYRLQHKIESEVSGEELERQLYVAKAQHQIEQAQKQAEIISLKNIELSKKAEEVQKKAEELEESYRNINVISEIGQKITSTFSFTRIANTIHKSLNSLMDAAVFGIALYDDSKKTIEYKVCIDGNKKINIAPVSIDDPRSLSVWCIKNCRVLCLNDVISEHTRYIQGYNMADITDRTMSVMYSPLMIDKKVVGAITVQSYKKNAYTRNNVKTMEALASYIAIALNNYGKSQEIKSKAAELEAVNSHLSIEISKRETAQKNLVEVNEKLEDLLSIDTLTGIYNRRGFEQFLRLEWGRSVRSGIPLSIILIDIDFFKGYNDKYGHVAGDDCLRKVSLSLLGTLKRPMDFLARYGGEEFIAILPNTKASGALCLGEEMRKSVEDLSIAHGKPIISPYVTISLGVSTIIPARNSSLKEFIKSADQALYKAKEEGRNRVCQSGTQLD